MLNLLRHVPVSVRARVYRASAAATVSATSASIVLAAIDQPAAAFVTAWVAGALGTVSATLAAAYTPLDFRD